MESGAINIMNTYIELWEDIQKKKWFLVFSVSLLVIAALSSIVNIEGLRKVLSEVENALRMLADYFHDKTLYYLIAYIFIHNAVVSFIALFLGIFFSFIPVFMIIANGYIIGVLSISHLSKIGLLIPHGIFELPAFILACSYGTWLGLWPLSHDRRKNLTLRIRQCMKIYFYLIMPLLMIAAVIEGSMMKLVK
jgi:stage II sporulation protein M